MASCVFPFFSCFLALGLVINCSARISLNNDRVGRKPAHLLRVAAQETETTELLWTKAKAAMEQSNFAEARRLLRQAIQQDPKDGALWFHLGVSCLETNELDEAIIQYSRKAP